MFQISNLTIPKGLPCLCTLVRIKSRPPSMAFKVLVDRAPMHHWFHLSSLVMPAGPDVTMCVLRYSRDLFSTPLPSCFLLLQVCLCTTLLSLLTPYIPCPLCLGNNYNSSFSEWELPTYTYTCACIYLPINKITTRWRQTTLCFHHE